MPEDQIAVLTGDIIGSTSLARDDLRRVTNVLQNTADNPVTWSRGDTWQIALRHPAQALRTALVITAALTAEKFATRISIATGSAPAFLPEDLNRATGDVFTRSGRALDDMPTDRRLVHADGGALDAVARLADAIAQGWTPTQAIAAQRLLHTEQPTRTAVAKGLGISRQAVDKSAHGADVPALLYALGAIEAET
ncbi:MAG: MarR family transcriptional regulator [Pseudomonadota bacterium]